MFFCFLPPPKPTFSTDRPWLDGWNTLSGRRLPSYSLSKIHFLLYQMSTRAKICHHRSFRSQNCLLSSSNNDGDAGQLTGSWVEYNDRLHCRSRRVWEWVSLDCLAVDEGRRRKVVFGTIWPWTFHPQKFPPSLLYCILPPFLQILFVILPDHNRDSSSLLVNCSSSFFPSQSPLAFFLANRRKNWSCYYIAEGRISLLSPLIFFNQRFKKDSFAVIRFVSQPRLRMPNHHLTVGLVWYVYIQKDRRHSMDGRTWCFDTRAAIFSQFFVSLSNHMRLLSDEYRSVKNKLIRFGDVFSLFLSLFIHTRMYRIFPVGNLHTDFFFFFFFLPRLVWNAPTGFAYMQIRRRSTM